MHSSSTHSHEEDFDSLPLNMTSANLLKRPNIQDHKEDLGTIEAIRFISNELITVSVKPELKLPS